MKLLLSLVAIATISLSSFGQATEGFKYQAVIRDASSLILTSQPVGIQLMIRQGSAGGSAVYTETFSPTTNGYGLVNLEIGTGTTTDDFTLIDWANGPYFIETAVDVTGGVAYQVMGTNQLMSVPYALYAKTAESVMNDLVDDADADPTNEFQAVSFSNDTLYLSNGGQVYLGSYGIDLVDDADYDPLNEIQDLQWLPGNFLSITNNGTPTIIDLNPFLDNTDTQLDGIGIASYGFVAGAHTIDTDTQLDSTGIASLGFTAGAIHNGGDIKHSILPTDHNGWYLLDGRLISTLSASAELTATNLGLSSNLPDMTGRFLKNTDGVDIVGTIGGSNSVTLTQANIPDYSLPVAITDANGTHLHTASSATTGDHDHTVSGTTSLGGDHSHSYNDYYWHDSSNSAAYSTPSGDDVGQRLEASRTSGTAGSHDHTFSATSSSTGGHDHAITVDSDGEHDHTVTVESGGSSTPLAIVPAHLVVYTFIYLGE